MRWCSKKCHKLPIISSRHWLEKKGECSTTSLCLGFPPPFSKTLPQPQGLQRPFSIYFLWGCVLHKRVQFFSLQNTTMRRSKEEQWWCHPPINRSVWDSPHPPLSYTLLLNLTSQRAGGYGHNKLVCLLNITDGNMEPSPQCALSVKQHEYYCAAG